jgi:uncharacterized protein (DUF983 family)
MKNTKTHQLGGVLKEKCPQCQAGDVFHAAKSAFDIFPKMKAACDSCGYHFEREPGFYQGAMFVSYGLSLVEGVIVFFILKWAFPMMDSLTVVCLIIVAITLLSMRNFRLSRMIWLYILPQ